MKKTIKQLQASFQADIASARSVEEIEAVRVAYLGRKAGKLNDILRSLKDLPIDEKKEVGQLANAVRTDIEHTLDTAIAAMKKGTGTQADLTLPGIPPQQGHLHPMTQTMEQLMDIFRSMGFMIYEGPELDNDFYNFESLNIPRSHPARDIQDTFFIKDTVKRTNEKRHFEHNEWVMRTHTSNMQVRIMEENEPPLRCIIPGRVFRNEATDASHEHTFFQLEGFVVDESVNIGQLVWTLREIFRQLYQKDVTVRLRPGYFPFTEPSFEPDMSCTFCEEEDTHCKVCKGTRWIEMGGSGMIHPKVFEAAGYEPGKYTGFAFGMGPSRLAMLKYGIPDIRMFMENDLRFLEQF